MTAPQQPSDLILLLCGPQWIPRDYFDGCDRIRIDAAFRAGARFCVGAAETGFDQYAQALLVQLCLDSRDESSFSRITVYNKGAKDGRLDARFQLANGYASYPARDKAMGMLCDGYIATLPAYANGSGGSLLPVMVFECRRAKVPNPEVVAEALFNAIRTTSEPWDEAYVRDTIAPLYQTRYGKTVHVATENE